MGIIKKTTWMVVGALGLLLGLGFADPSNTRLMPSFFSKDSPLGVVPKGAADEEGIYRAIAQFNRSLSAAYLEQNPASLKAYPMDDGLRRHYAEEIAFLEKDGMALELSVGAIRIEKVTRLPSLLLSVDTVESVRVRYLNASDRTEIVSYPETSYAMNYTLDKSSSGWRIADMETTKVAKRDE